MTLILAVLLVASPAQAQSGAGGHMSAPAVAVITTPIVVEENRQSFVGIGTGRAQRSVNLYPRVAEVVTQIHFAAGDRVEKDALLMQLDDRAEKLAVSLAEIKLDEAKSLLGRFTQAGKEGAVPESEVDAARTAYEAARIALAQARLARDMRQLRAPIAGVIGLPAIDEGDRVDTSTFIAALDDRTILQVDFDVPEALALPLLSSDEPLSITATTPAYGPQKFSGRILALDNRVSQTKRTLRARAEFDNKQDLLRPGMSFRVLWSIAGERYPTVPEIAVQWEREGAFIWVVRNDAAEKIRVDLVARRDGKALIKADVKSGEPVVIEGLQRLRPGSPVTATSGQSS